MVYLQRILFFILILILILILGYFWPKINGKVVDIKTNLTNEISFVTRVIDGDTIELSNNDKVRLLGRYNKRLEWMGKYGF